MSVLTGLCHVSRGFKAGEAARILSEVLSWTGGLGLGHSSTYRRQSPKESAFKNIAASNADCTKMTSAVCAA